MPEEKIKHNSSFYQWMSYKKFTAQQWLVTAARSISLPSHDEQLSHHSWPCTAAESTQRAERHMKMWKTSAREMPVLTFVFILEQVLEGLDCDEDQKLYPRGTDRYSLYKATKYVQTQLASSHFTAETCLGGYPGISTGHLTKPTAACKMGYNTLPQKGTTWLPRTFANVLLHQLRAWHTDECTFGVVSHSSSQQGLASTGWTIQQNTLHISTQIPIQRTSH